MPRTSQAEAKAYAKAHYQANKHNYNPLRKQTRTAAEVAFEFSLKVLTLSEQRFVYPDELPRMLAEMLGADDFEEVRDRVVVALDRAIYAKGYLPNEAKTHGLFLRRAPFAHHRPFIKRTFLRQLSLIPKSKRGVRAELLILNLVLKDL